MSKIKVDLKNCYGIGNLEHEFEFTAKCPYALIYAPNGTMKTSFTKTFQAYAIGETPADLVYKDRETHAVICEEDGTAIAQDSIYVVNPEKFVSASKSITTFLASEELKQEYDTVHQELSIALKRFYVELSSISHSSDCGTELREAFAINDQESDLEVLERVYNRINGLVLPAYNFKYNDIFDGSGKVREFIQKNRHHLEEYFTEYNNVLTQSDFFKVADNVVFGTEQADVVLKSLKDNSFFKVGHKITLVGDNTIDTYEGLKAKYDGELARIVNNPAVKKVFEKIDSAIGKNKELRAFKAAIFAHNEYLVDLLDYETFRKKVWKSYLLRNADSYRQLIDLYQQKKPIIIDILNRASQEQTAWKNIIDIFNVRFHAPFRVEVKNQRNVLINAEDAQLKFYYCEDPNGADLVERTPESLVGEVLSKGERRAFCLLQIIFEIEVRKTKPLLLIFDDIADSFDYKNKYAIIEYIQELRKHRNVRTIILTHNFDFYRTISSRLSLNREHNVFLATKDPVTRVVKLKQGQFLYNLLLNWIKNPNNKRLLAMLPFVRNLVEYIQGENSVDYLLLTSCLHNIKREDPKLRITKTVLVDEVRVIYQTTLPTITNIESVWINGDQPWIDMLVTEARNVSEELDNGQLDEISLENKIVLAMTIRLIAEAFMEKKLLEHGAPPVSGNNRFGKLFDSFGSHNLGNESEYAILNRVSLMTPEQIHMNSFMYEPLVDMSIRSLKTLYMDVCKWNISL